MGELPSLETNTRDRKRKRVGLRDTLGKKQRISAVGNKQIWLQSESGTEEKGQRYMGTCLRDSSEYSWAGTQCVCQAAGGQEAEVWVGH